MQWQCVLSGTPCHITPSSKGALHVEILGGNDENASESRVAPFWGHFNKECSFRLRSFSHSCSCCCCVSFCLRANGSWPKMERMLRIWGSYGDWVGYVCCCLVDWKIWPPAVCCSPPQPHTHTRTPTRHTHYPHTHPWRWGGNLCTPTRQPRFFPVLLSTLAKYFNLFFYAQPQWAV